MQIENRAAIYSDTMSAYIPTTMTRYFMQGSWLLY